MKRICKIQIANRPLIWWIALVVFLAILALVFAAGIDGPRAHGTSYWNRIGTFSGSTYTFSLVSYNSKLYAGTDNHAGVYRYNSGTSWTRINSNGFGDSGNDRTLSMTVFGTDLYMGTRNIDSGCEVWKWNGSSFSQVNTDGFGNPFLRECNRLCVYDGALYAGVYCHIFRYDGGTSWTQVNDPSFGDSNNRTSTAMTNWNGYLWVGTENTATGSEVWRYDGISWTQANINGFGFGANYESTNSFCIFNSKLYCGGGYMGRVLRWNGGTSWTQIGSTGLTDPTNNAYIGSLVSFDGRLFASTLTPVGSGCQVCSWTGSSWIQENNPGFGDPNNGEVHTSTVFGSQLYVGTKNGNGAQVWRSGGTAPTSSSVYLAEGTTDWGFDEYISIENPNTSVANVSLTYQTKGGPVAGPAISMASKSQTTVNPRETVGNTDFSTKVTCTNGKTIAADRTMTWNAGGGEEGHCAVAVTAPAKTWYLAEGSSAWGFECYLLIQNPGITTANCTLTYMIEGASPVTVPVQVPAGSRGTWNIADHIGSHDASIKVTSDQPVIPERAMYRNNRREGHDSTGTTTPATDYYLAEGATGYDVGYITYVLVQNPNDSPADVSLTYMTGSGQIAGPSFQMGPNSRKTIRVNDQLPPNTNVSTKVSGDKPIIAERAMYWNNGTGEACHDSIGMASPHSIFYLPDGETSNGRETWTLVQNPNSSPVTIEIDYLTPSGQVVPINDTVAANSRKTYFMADAVPSGRAAIMVTSQTSGKSIMVERAMYWNSRGAGTDTIGGYTDN